VFSFWNWQKTGKNGGRYWTRTSDPCDVNTGPTTRNPLILLKLPSLLIWVCATDVLPTFSLVGLNQKALCYGDELAQNGIELSWDRPEAY
jgi:hypothetical protein